MPALPGSFALLQAVRALRYCSAVRMHAADSRADSEQAGQERLYVFRISHDRGKRHVAGDLRYEDFTRSTRRSSQRRAQGLRRSVQEVVPAFLGRLTPNLPVERVLFLP